MEGTGTVVGTHAPNFVLPDHTGQDVALNEFCREGPVLLVFYPGDFTPVCTKQLCNYRDNLDQFFKFGIRVVGISSNSVEDHKRFAARYQFPFPLLSDQDKTVAKLYKCHSFLMFGAVSRAVFIIDKNQRILYRYVEPTVLTRRSADELVGILRDLKAHNLI